MAYIYPLWRVSRKWVYTAVPRFSSRWTSLGVFPTLSCSALFRFSGVFSPPFFSSPVLFERKKMINLVPECEVKGHLANFNIRLTKGCLYCALSWHLSVKLLFLEPARKSTLIWSLLLLEELLERAPESSLVFATPLAEGCVIVLLCPTPPLWLVHPWLVARVLTGENTMFY